MKTDSRTDNLRFSCLLLDHDDTVVESTAAVHYPAYLEIMRTMRPDQQPLTLNGWWEVNFHPGISSYLRDALRMTAEELKDEYAVWRSYSTRIVPPFFPGMRAFLSEYKDAGGRIAVISHSEEENIRRDYRENVGPEAEPDLVFGWDRPESLRKPSPHPVYETLRALGVPRERALIVDDLKPAVLMARAGGVAIAAAGWAHNIPRIRRFMETRCDAYLRSVEELRSFVMGR